MSFMSCHVMSTSFLKDIKSMFLTISNQLKKLDKIDKIETIVEKLSEDLKETRNEMLDLKKENEHLKDEMKDIKDELNKQRSLAEKNQRRIIDVQARSMRENLVFYNIPESEAAEDPLGAEKLVKEVIKESLKIDEEMRFERVHRMGAKFNEDGSRKTRPIVAKFSSYKQKEKVKGEGSKLKDSNVGMGDQYPREIQQRRKELWNYYKDARNKGHRVKLVLDKLYVDGQEFCPEIDE